MQRNNGLQARRLDTKNLFTSGIARRPYREGAGWPRFCTEAMSYIAYFRDEAHRYLLYFALLLWYLHRSLALCCRLPASFCTLCRVRAHVSRFVECDIALVPLTAMMIVSLWATRAWFWFLYLSALYAWFVNDAQHFDFAEVYCVWCWASIWRSSCIHFLNTRSSHDYSSASMRLRR